MSGSGLPAEALAKMREQLPGVEIPTDAAGQRALLAALGKVLGQARKAMPKRPPVRFEHRTEKGDDGKRVETDEVVLRVQRGGKGAPLVVTQHAARLLVECADAVAEFARTGAAADLPTLELQEEDDSEE